MSYQTGSIAGILTLPDGGPLVGHVEIIPEINGPAVLDAGGNVAISGRAKADLDAGMFEVTVPASSDGNLNPAGVLYTVKVVCRNATAYSVRGVFVPAGETVNLASVMDPSTTSPTYAVQVTRAEFDALAAQVAAGGGTGGPVDLTAEDVGADPAGSAVAAVAEHLVATDPHGDRAWTTTQIQAALNGLINSAPGTLDTLGEIAAQLAADQSAVAALTDAINGKVPSTRKVNGKPLSSDVTVTKGDVGLGNVDDTPDAGKPVSGPQRTAIDGKADAVGPWRDLVRAAQLGYSHTGAVLSDSTADNLAGTTEWPLLTLKLLAAAYPAVRMEHLQWDDTGQAYGAATVVNAGAAPTGGTVADDGFSGTGNAVGAAADGVGTWQSGTGTVTKSSGTAAPAANSGLAFLAPSQDAKATLDMIVTTAGMTGGAQAYRVGVAYSNAGLSGFGLQAILTIASASSTSLTLRKYKNGDGAFTTISSETLNLGLGNVTAQPATFSIELAAGHVTVTVTVGATVTTREFDIPLADYAGLGSYAGAASAANVGAVTFDRLRVATPVIPTPTLRMYNGAVAGKNTDYPRPRLAAMLPVAMDSVVLSYGHNANLIPGGVTGFLNDYALTLAAVKTAQPAAVVYVGSQNPEFPPFDAAKVAAHAARQSRLRAYAVANGCRYVPVFEAFAESSTDNGLALVQPDGVHPTNPPGGAVTDGYGSTLWARTMTGIAAPAQTGGLTQAAADARYEQLVAGNPGVVCPLTPAAWFPAGPVMQHLNQTPAEANEQCVPFIAGRTTTLTGLAIQVATAGSAGAVIRLGVRADNGQGKPGALLVDAGTVDGTTTGVKQVTVNVPVTAGTRYWVTVTVQGGATTRPQIVSLYNLSAPTFGAATAADSLANTNFGWRVSGVTGALAASFTPDNMAGSPAKVAITAAT